MGNGRLVVVGYEKGQVVSYIHFPPIVFSPIYGAAKRSKHVLDNNKLLINLSVITL